jgi:uncharacterized paraquat-inducible protein A
MEEMSGLRLILNVAQAMSASQDSTGKCPECDAPVLVACELVLGRQLRCSNCGAALEIVEASPLQLDYAFMAPIEGHQIIRP